MTDPSAYFSAEDFARGALHERAAAIVGWVSFGLDTALLVALALGPVGKKLFEVCGKVRPAPGPVARALGPEWAAGAAFLALVAVLREVVGLPTTIAGQLVALELGLSHEGVGAYLAREALHVLFGVAGFVLLGLALVAVRRRFPKRWWLTVGAVAGVLLVADTMAEPWRLRIDYTPVPLAEGPLRTRLEGLVERTQAGFRELVVVDASRYGTRANALATGFGPTLQIVITDTLLAYGDEAVAGAVAHEIGHRRADRLPWRLALAALACVAFLGLVEAVLRFAARRGSAEPRGLALVIAVTSGLLLTTQPLRAAFGRAEEREADALELSIRQDLDAYVEEQVRLVRSNALTPEPTGWAAITSDHPSALERITKALEVKAARAAH